MDSPYEEIITEILFMQWSETNLIIERYQCPLNIGGHFYRGWRVSSMLYVSKQKF